VAKQVEPGAVSMGASSGASRLQRFGYGIASLPFVLIVLAQLIAPGFMEPLFANPPDILGLPAGIVLLFVVVIWAAMAFAVIRGSRSGPAVALALLVFTIPAIVAILYLPAMILIALNLTA